ncbi:hypothetical protein [Luteolibacter marinus]|uniref:hypothetical protein n=1 Tax=Luteolibacter marinus TaxID=2776705 RepID=UPI001865CC63|nr:hypothetical protein [Luteolibacter marinus]
MLPAHLNFEADYDETASNLRILRRAVENGVRIRTIDFSRLKKMSTSAALVLASTVDQWNIRVKGKLKADLPSWDERILVLFYQMGFFDLLGLPQPKVELPTSKIEYLKFSRGQVGEADPGSIAVELRKRIEEIVGIRIKRPELFEGLSEAITNVCHHAYNEVNDDRRKYWWVSASFNRENKELKVTFYDKGVGIPRTLPAHDLFEKIRTFFFGWGDSQKIEAAMELGRTSTKKAERGHGLQNLVRFARAHSRGRIRIYSIKGVYEEVFEVVDNQVKSSSFRPEDFRTSIGGTLIEWSVTL